MLKPAVLLVSVLIAAAPAGAVSALVLPVDGPGLLPTLRAALEGGLRQALLAERDGARRPVFELASPEDTAAVLADAAGAGLACSLEDAACLVRIGVIAGVDEVFAPIALLEGTVLQLRVTRVEVTRRRAVVVAAGVVVHPAKDDGRTLVRLTERLLRPAATLDVDGPAGATIKIAGAVVGTVPLAAPVSVDAGVRDVQALAGGRVVARQSVTLVDGHQQVTLRAPEPTTATATTATATTATKTGTTTPPTEPPPATSNSPLVLAGGASLGLGSLLAIGGAVGAGFVEAGLSTPRPGQDDVVDVQAQRNVGLALIGAAVVGSAAAVAGGILLGVGLAP